MIHEFKCASCNLIYDEYISPSQKVTANCPSCNGPGLKIFSANPFKIDNEFFSHQLGAQVKGKKDEENELKQLDYKHWEKSEQN